MPDEEVAVVEPAAEESDFEVHYTPLPGVPTINDDEPPKQVDYRDWLPHETKVVSGPLGTKNFPGRRFVTRDQARRYWEQRAGRIIEEHKVDGRYVFRVRRVA